MAKVGQAVMKIAGRDAGNVGIIVDVINDNYVLVDGMTRRRKCNIKHLEFLDAEVKIKKNAGHSEIVKVLETLGFKISENKGSKKEAKEKPRKIRKSSRKEKLPATENKKTAKEGKK